MNDVQRWLRLLERTYHSPKQSRLAIKVSGEIMNCRMGGSELRANVHHLCLVHGPEARTRSHHRATHVGYWLLDRCDGWSQVKQTRAHHYPQTLALGVLNEYLVMIHRSCQCSHWRGSDSKTPAFLMTGALVVA